MTLVELMLAIGMFSFLMASVGHLVLTSLRVQRSWAGAVLPAQTAEHALNRLARDLQAAQPLFDVPFQVLSGGEGVEFARLGSDGWHRVAYRLEPDGGMRQFVRDEGLQQETLAWVATGRIAVGMVNGDGQLVWASSWDGQAHGIPRLVKFEGEPLSRVFRNPAGTLPTVQP